MSSLRQRKLPVFPRAAHSDISALGNRLNSSSSSTVVFLLFWGVERTTQTIFFVDIGEFREKVRHY